MTTQEFSDGFDNYINSFYKGMVNKGNKDHLELIHFDEYEKSLFLSLAQDEVVIDIYTGRLTGESFEKTEEIREYLKNLIKSDKGTLVTENNNNTIRNLTKEYSEHKSSLFTLPDDTLFITYEVAILQKNSNIATNYVAIVVPTTQDELFRTLRNPFRNSNKLRVLRIDADNGQSELFCNKDYNVTEYIVKYIQKPSPIVLIDLSDTGLSINGVSNVSECSLDPSIHKIILERAVQKAIASKNQENNK